MNQKFQSHVHVSAIIIVLVLSCPQSFDLSNGGLGNKNGITRLLFLLSQNLVLTRTREFTLLCFMLAHYAQLTYKENT